MFERKGFLGENNKKFSETLQKNNEELYDLLSQATRIAQDAINRSKGKELDGRQILIISMFLKILNRAESTISIMEKGIEADAIYLLRGMIEAVIILKLTCQSEEFMAKYFGNEVVQNISVFNAILDNRNIFLDNTKVEFDIIAGTKKKAESLKAELSLKKINMEELAKEVGLNGIYQTAYRYFSKEVHFHPSRLEGYLVLNDNKMTATRTRISEDAAKIIVTVLSLLLEAINSYCEYMNLELKQRISKFESELATLGGQLVE